MSPSDRQPSETSAVVRGARWWGVLLALYVLSTGLVEKLHDAGVIPAKAMSIYAPLEFLCEHVPPIETFFFWYIFGVWQCEFLTHYP